MANVFVGIKLKIISIYLNPSLPLPTMELESLFTDYNHNTLILGDFNAHSTLWGSAITLSKGVIIENIITRSNMILLNDGSPTHLSTRSADIAPLSFWNTDNQLCDKANWQRFQQQLCNINLQTDSSTNVNKEIAKLQKVIINAANSSMPHQKNSKNSKYTYWYSPELNDLRNKKTKTILYIQKSPIDGKQNSLQKS
ncbi:uncharacterized protein LOC124418644 [Lucilia cuprina]|uniref:uncharacterized protein LOC124418644 n=1 Tax=Lucilia cuprina TaxID=7375 RepID=UPI001F06744C|nr:uncharacterized protein LOC124418644 [Lucilia cuprina]